jgi:hypothetical protein
MSTSHPRRRFFVVTLAALVACTSDPASLCGCEPGRPAGRIHGMVRGPDGAGVAGARVRAQASAASCAAPFQPIGEGVTDARGRYGVTVYQEFDPRPAGVCLRAYADPPAQSMLRASDTLRFEVDFTTGVFRDSARMDLVLRAP